MQSPTVTWSIFRVSCARDCRLHCTALLLPISPFHYCLFTLTIKVLSFTRSSFHLYAIRWVAPLATALNPSTHKIFSTCALYMCIKSTPGNTLAKLNNIIWTITCWCESVEHFQNLAWERDGLSLPCLRGKVINCSLAITYYCTLQSYKPPIVHGYHILLLRSHLQQRDGDVLPLFQECQIGIVFLLRVCYLIYSSAVFLYYTLFCAFDTHLLRFILISIKMSNSMCKVVNLNINFNTFNIK